MSWDNSFQMSGETLLEVDQLLGKDEVQSGLNVTPLQQEPPPSPSATEPEEGEGGQRCGNRRKRSNPPSQVVTGGPSKRSRGKAELLDIAAGTDEEVMNMLRAITDNMTALSLSSDKAEDSNAVASRRLLESCAAMVATQNQVLESRAIMVSALQLKEKVERLTRELQQKDTEREAALALQREELLAVQAERLQHLRIVVMQERQTWFRTGACHLKALFLRSPVGQPFLEVLKSELIHGYRRSPCSLFDFGRVGAYFMREGTDIAFADCQLSDEQKAKCDNSTVFGRIDKAKAEQYAHCNSPLSLRTASPGPLLRIGNKKRERKGNIICGNIIQHK